MQWDSSLECGVEQVDSEHRQLFNFVEKLAGITREEPDSEAIDKALEFLGSYVAEHFIHEEALMQACGYPQFCEHKALHQGFVNTFACLKRKYHESGESSLGLREIYYAAAAWLVNHVSVIDYRFAQYYKEYMRRAGKA